MTGDPSERVPERASADGAPIGREPDSVFTRHRRLLFTVAYEMLGSAADAEDVVQETWLRWAGVEHSEIRDARAYLVRIATRQSLNRLRSLARRREEYVGTWLPEPLATGPDLAADVELAEHVSVAMLTVLESLGPVERAVFVLREVFDTPYDEIAEAVGKSGSAVRQIAHRAREHVAARRPRYSVSAEEQRDVVERFLTAVREGDLQGLLDVLAPDVVGVADGGGLAPAARRPIEGAERMARFLLGVSGSRELDIELAWLNGRPGGVVRQADRVIGAVSCAIDGGRIARIFAVSNPEKLARLGSLASLTRT